MLGPGNFITARGSVTPLIGFLTGPDLFLVRKWFIAER